MDSIITSAQLDQLETAMKSKIQFLTGTSVQSAPWGYTDARGGGILQSALVDSWDAFLTAHGAAESAADVALAATGYTLADLQSVPASSVSVKLYDHVGEDLLAVHFHNIDYRRQVSPGRLFRGNTFGATPGTRGVLVSVGWYAQSAGSPPVLSDLIVREDFTYNRDIAGFATDRSQIVSWIRQDGSDDPETKTRKKFYTAQEQVAERRRVRENMTTIAQSQIVERLALDMGSQAAAATEMTQFVGRNHDAFRRYADNDGPELVASAIPSDQAAWLDSSYFKPSLSMRNYMILWFSGQVIA